MEVAEAVPAVAIDEAPQTVEGVVARDGVKIVMYTIRGFRGRTARSRCLVGTASMAGLGKIAAFQHRPGTGNIRPERALIVDDVPTTSRADELGGLGPSWLQGASFMAETPPSQSPWESE